MTIQFKNLFTTPVTDVSKGKFLGKVGGTTERVIEYLNDKLSKEFRLPSSTIEKLCSRVDEVVCNSFDSYVRRDLQLKDSLIIRVIGYNYNERLFLQIADNGLGFENRKKGELFYYHPETDICDKSNGPYIGGVGRGILDLIQAGEESGFTVHFKNGKKVGASLIIAFADTTDSKEEVI